jgi:HD-like signal output (HDOD) protein
MPLDEQTICSAIQSCPRLGSLRKVNSAFQDLANADQDNTGQIAEIIRRDPSLTSRLLTMVNSVFYALSDTVSSIEDAVFYLGTKQIRQMALATPVLEDLQQFTSNAPDIDWISFWQQSIGCAVMTRELLSFTDLDLKGDADYVSGLIFGVGYLVSFHAFPNQMGEIMETGVETEEQIRELQREHIGWDQAQIGAFYLKVHNIPNDIHVPVQYQFEPEKCMDYPKQAAALYLAKRMLGSLLREGSNGEDKTASKTSLSLPLPHTPAWDLCPELHTLLGASEDDFMFTVSSLKYTLEQLPQILKGLV